MIPPIRSSAMKAYQRPKSFSTVIPSGSGPLLSLRESNEALSV